MIFAIDIIGLIPISYYNAYDLSTIILQIRFTPPLNFET